MWQRLTEALGEAYVRVWAEQQVLDELDGRTVAEALADGVNAKRIWRAAWRFLELPDRYR